MKRKKCLRCGLLLLLKYFGKDKSRKDGVSVHCKKCCKKYNKEYCQNNKKKVREIRKKYRETNKEYIKSQGKKYRHSNKEYFQNYSRKYYQNNKKHYKDVTRKSHLRRDFNITEKEFKNLLRKQNYHCAICCGKNGKRMFNIDHNHKTGRIRGLLCSNCNKGLGFFKDNILNIKNALRYLKNG